MARHEDSLLLKDARVGICLLWSQGLGRGKGTCRENTHVPKIWRRFPRCKTTFISYERFPRQGEGDLVFSIM